MKRILVIQLYRLGDVLQSTAAVRALKKKYTGAKVDLVVDESCAVMVEDNRYINRIFTLKRKSMQERTAANRFHDAVREAEVFLSNIGAYEYDLAVNLTFEPLGGIILDRARAREKRGLSYEGCRFRLLDPWTKYLFAAIEKRNTNPINLTDLFRFIAGCSDTPACPYLKAPKDNESIREKYFDFPENRPVIALQPAASKPYRTLDPKETVMLAHELSEKFNVLYLGSKGEEHYAEGLLENRSLKNLTAKTGMKELFSIINNADLLISPDTVTNHIAAALGTKVLTYFYGNGLPQETAPYSEDVFVLCAHESCQPCDAPEKCVNSFVCKKGIDRQTLAKSAENILLDAGNKLPFGLELRQPKLEKCLYFDNLQKENIFKIIKEIGLIYDGNVPRMNAQRIMSDKVLGNAILKLEKDLLAYRQ